MTRSQNSLRRFAAKSVVWRHVLDFAVAQIPFYLQPILLTFTAGVFYFLAAEQRRWTLRNLIVVIPGSSSFLNHCRAFRTIWNFSWTIAEAASYRINKTEFTYEIEGAEFLDRLSTARGAIVLTAHMGSYDLGAALFAQKYQREIRMVRAPEPDQQAAQHLHSAVEEAGQGAVRIAYNTVGALLSFDLLTALRAGEIVSIQGDRIIEGVAGAEGRMFGEAVSVPSGPFTLAQVAEAPIFPLFIVRAGYRRYRVIVREPFLVPRTGAARADDLAAGVASWCRILEETITRHLPQWFAFGPVFLRHV